LPAYNAANGNYYGWFLLLTGYYAMASGEFSWWANVFLWTSWSMLACRPRGVTLASAIIAIALALSFTTNETAWVYKYDRGQAEFSLQVGFYVWLISMGCAAAAGIADLMTEQESDDD
jgi:hypothetical protein